MLNQQAPNSAKSSTPHVERRDGQALHHVAQRMIASSAAAVRIADQDIAQSRRVIEDAAAYLTDD